MPGGDVLVQDDGPATGGPETVPRPRAASTSLGPRAEVYSGLIAACAREHVGNGLFDLLYPCEENGQSRVVAPGLVQRPAYVAELGGTEKRRPDLKRGLSPSVVGVWVRRWKRHAEHQGLQVLDLDRLERPPPMCAATVWLVGWHFHNETLTKHPSIGVSLRWQGRRVA